MRALYLVVGTAMLTPAEPAAAQLRPLLDPPASADAARGGVEVYLLNEGRTVQPASGPAEIETMAKDGTRLRLIAAPDAPPTVAPGGFARLHYRLAASYPVAVAPPAPLPLAPLPLAPLPLAVAANRETVVDGSAGISSAFVDRFRPYEPIYGVAGTGTAGAKLQVSIDFRLLGRADGPRLDFAYTQAMFWAIDRPSAPFRATNYSPEIFVDLPVGEALNVGALNVGAGYRHDSNGGGPASSVDVNRLYLRASGAFTLGRGWELSVTPKAWIYFGEHGNAPGLERYWGNAALAASIGQRDGLKFVISGRGNFGTGRGGVEAFLSWPVARIGDRLPHLYLFGQMFSGYGEALSDYRISATHARIGIALTR